MPVNGMYLGIEYITEWLQKSIFTEAIKGKKNVNYFALNASRTKLRESSWLWEKVLTTKS